MMHPLTPRCALFCTLCCALSLPVGVARAANVDVQLDHDAVVVNDGTPINVDVNLVNNTSKDVLIRLFQLDFDSLDPVFTPGNFAFDHSTLVSNALYATFSGSVPSQVYTGASPIPGFILSIPANGGVLHAASFTLTPAPDQYGIFTIDATNPSSPDNNFGARLDYGFGLAPDDPITTLWSGDGTLGGGTSTIGMTPEPVSLSMLLIGTAMLARRRR